MAASSSRSSTRSRSKCPLDLIPEKLHVRIKNLQIGGHLTIKDIFDLPAGATSISDDDEMIVHCVMPATEEEAEAEARAPSRKSSARARTRKKKKARTRSKRGAWSLVQGVA